MKYHKKKDLKWNKNGISHLGKNVDQTYNHWYTWLKWSSRRVQTAGEKCPCVTTFNFKMEPQCKCSMKCSVLHLVRSTRYEKVILWTCIISTTPCLIQITIIVLLNHIIVRCYQILRLYLSIYYISISYNHYLEYLLTWIIKCITMERPCPMSVLTVHVFAALS